MRPHSYKLFLIQKMFTFCVCLFFIVKGYIQQPGYGPNREQNVYLSNFRYRDVLHSKYECLFVVTAFYQSHVLLSAIL